MIAGALGLGKRLAEGVGARQAAEIAARPDPLLVTKKRVTDFAPPISRDGGADDDVAGAVSAAPGSGVSWRPHAAAAVSTSAIAARRVTSRLATSPLEGGPAVQRVAGHGVAMLAGLGQLRLVGGGIHRTLHHGPTRAPKFEPSRSGLRWTLNTVPGPNVFPVMSCRASCAVPAISMPHSTYFPSSPLARDL